MGKQTFIVKTWSGADTYSEALEKDKPYDFYRLDCKMAATALEDLKKWKKKTEPIKWSSVHKDLWGDGAKYEIIATPDGCTETEVVYSGYTADL